MPSGRLNCSENKFYMELIQLQMVSLFYSHHTVWSGDRIQKNMMTGLFHLKPFKVFGLQEWCKRQVKELEFKHIPNLKKHNF